MGASAANITSGIAPGILDGIARGATILTANQRAARTLHRAYEEAQQAAGERRWTPPAIFALDTWLKTLWQQMLVSGNAERILLNPTQEHVLWRDLVAADREVSGLRSADALSDLAASAWQALHLAGGAAQLREALHTTDTRAFERWALQFDRLCQRELYITVAELPTALDSALSEGALDLTNAGVVLVDFDQHPAAVARLLGSIEQAGYPVERVQSGVPAGEAPQLYAAADPANELRAAARWAGGLLARNPGQRVAVVVPNLAARRPELERTFSEHLAPGTFEFSLGVALGETAYTVNALDLLRWTLHPLALERVSALLLSPQLRSRGEPAAEFDAYDLRQARLLRPEISLDDTIDLLRRSERKQRLAQLHARLRALRKAAVSLHAEQDTHLHWAAAFQGLLEAVGYVRSAQIDSFTFQLQRRWLSALDLLATLDFNGDRVSAGQAIQALDRITARTIFAPESTGAPVQIVGPLELGGLPFDALWFVSADDRTWPMTTGLNPLLPWPLQRTLGMPGADPARDQERAEALTERIARSAEQVVFSYAVHAEDAAQRPSPLLRELHLIPREETAQNLSATALEAVADTSPIPGLPQTTLQGGANVLALEAACSFRAFAERRLYSADLDAPEAGLDARDRGNLVHKVMQGFWNRLKTQQALRDLSLAERHAFLDECIAEALARTERQVRGPWDAAYLDVQRQRLRQLLRPWLELELSRPNFTVLATEHEAKAMQIGALTLDLRVDRIDQTPAGALILDYKTGEAKPVAWNGDRPDAPQLPLYAVLAAQSPEVLTNLGDGSAGLSSSGPDQLAGVAFAVVRAGRDITLNGFADTDGVFGKTSAMPHATLQAQLEDWHRVLEDLAYAFAQGEARVDPKAYPVTCRHCTQRILCRLDPTTLAQYSDDEDDFPPSPEDFLRG